MRRLHPDPAPVEAMGLLGELCLGERARAERPYTVANFVSSVDGRATLDGGSTGLGDDGDKQIFRGLRGSCDAILAGTATMAAEGYGALARDPSVVALRARLGLAPQPLGVTVTRSGTLPDFPLQHDPGSTLLVYSGADIAREPTAADVRIIRRDPDQLTMAAVLADLRAEHGVRMLLCEGGPSIFGELVAEGVADELFLTLAAKLTGGDGSAITRHLSLDDPRAVDLVWVLEQAGSLFLRYRLNP